MEKLLRETEADEVIVVTDTYEFADRLRSYELVAEVAREVVGRTLVSDEAVDRALLSDKA